MNKNIGYFLLGVVVVWISASLPNTVRADSVVISDNFTNSYEDYNPWGCSDSAGLIRGVLGGQLVVADNGVVSPQAISPSIAAGDLNGDGLPDLVVADAAGFFWYLQNHGTKTAPSFTKAEIMPIWLGDPIPNLFAQEGLVGRNYAPRIQLVDVNNDGKLDLVVGTYPGKLCILNNQGSSQSPAFRQPTNLNDATIATHTGGRLWCNYLAPFFYDWQHNGIMDLIMGDGSYSANSIYYLKNKGTSDRPIFRDEDVQKIIPGFGREHLIPQVIAWNGDGKNDILASERSGALNIFLYQREQEDTHTPVFDEGHHVKIGGQERLKELSTVSIADLYGTGLPGLLIGTTDGYVSFSRNTGDAKNFQFGPPEPLKLTEPKPPLFRPKGWGLDGSYGSPYDLLVCTNAKVEPGFKLPDEAQASTALRYYRDEPQPPNPTFLEHFYPPFDIRYIRREGQFPMKAASDYVLSMWIKGTGEIRNLTYAFFGTQPDPGNPQNLLGTITISDEIGLGDNWNKVELPIHYTSLSSDHHATVAFDLSFHFTGKGSFYLAALKLESKE